MKYRVLISAALATFACAVLVASAVAAPRARLYQFTGEVLGAGATSLQVQVEGGNPVALRALVGQSQDQTFTIGPKTEILVWQKGIPHVATTGDLAAGDWVVVNVRTAPGSSLAEIDATPAGTVADHGKQPNGPGKPLYLFVGTVAGPQSDGHIALHVVDGNRLALRSLLGQPVDQTFTYSYGTIFLLWQGKVPTVISPSQLKPGDRITVRIRADRTAGLAQVESTPAAHVGDHEPAAADPSLTA
jgi:hypothetical protein